MDDDRTHRFPQSRLARFLKVGTAASAVGASYFGQRLRALVSPAEKAAQSLSEAHSRNADRLVRTMGELKGAVMKVGQFLSLQADILPREITDSLAKLQQQAPPVAFPTMRRQIEAALGRPVAEAFRELGPEPYAAASIGQVYRATDHDGRQLVVKVQYPGVDRTIDSDMANVRLLFRAFAKITPLGNIDTLVEEIRDRLWEELDYEQEARNLREFRELFADDPRVVIPEPVEDLSSRQVLAMEYVGGWHADALCAPGVSQERRNLLGSILAELVYRQFFEFRRLHADPNLANFRFTADDRVVIYDFGCVKRFPVEFVASYAAVVRDAFAGRLGRIDADLRRLGFRDPAGQAIEQEIIDAYAQAILEAFPEGRRYDLGASDLPAKVMALNLRHWTRFLNFEVPRDIIFLDRVLLGTFGNLRKLRATADWRALVETYLSRAPAPEGGGA